MPPVLIAYIPVLHDGYRQLFARHPEARELYLCDETLMAEFAYLVKDIRRLPTDLTRRAIASWNLFERITLLDAQTIVQLQKAHTPLIVSDDDITSAIIATHFPAHPITRDTIFLRWDKKTSMQPVRVSPDAQISTSEIDQMFITQAAQEGLASRDWWRRIGAIAVQHGKILLRAHNLYVPTEQIAYAEGDPRSNFTSGVHLESSLALHAEASLVAQAAKEGISLAGVDIYAETFPCPPCAKQLAYAGIAKLFYRTGYAVLDGERILKSQGVQIIFVP